MVTIQIPDGGLPFDAELLEDEFAMLWLHQTDSRGKRKGFQGLLSAALKIGWRIVTRGAGAA
jgi:hypothetical protein